MTTPYILISLSTLLCYLISRYVASSRRRWAKGCEPPLEAPPSALPPHDQLAKFGCTVRSKRVFEPAVFLTMEPQNIQAIYSTDFHSYGVGPIRHFAFKPLLGNGAMNTDGAFWEQSRALLRPIFTRSQVDDLGALDKHVQNLIRIMPRDTSTVDLQPLFARMDLDFSTEFIFGESAASLTSQSTVDAKSFLDAYNTAQIGLAYRIRISPWNIFHRDKIFWKCCRTVHEYVDNAVNRALLHRTSSSKEAEPNSQHILAYDLVERISDPVQLRDHLMNVFLPGHDTAAILLSNVFFALARHPAVFSKLREEILAVRDITADGLKRLPYLQSVINETLRLWGPVTYMTRVALKDTRLPAGGGRAGTSPVFVPKGSILTISYKALHRRKDLWGDDADAFRPERWSTLKLVPWSFMPFSGGPRVCPGRQRALTECSYVLVKLIQRIQAVENRDPVLEYEDLYKLATESRNGVKVALGWA